MYRRIVGRLNFLTNIRPDTQYFVNQVARFMHQVQAEHLMAVKQILMYLKRTPTFAVFYSESCSPSLEGYIEVDWANNTEDRISVISYVFKIAGGPVP